MFKVGLRDPQTQDTKLTIYISIQSTSIPTLTPHKQIYTEALETWLNTNSVTIFTGKSSIILNSI